MKPYKTQPLVNPVFTLAEYNAPRLFDSTGRLVLDPEIDSNSDGSCYFCSAVYLDGTEVPEDEIYYLDGTYPEYLEEYAMDRAIMAAESYYEGER